MKFKSLTTHAEIDLVPYIKDYLLTHSDTKLYIGCDSQTIKNRTSYALVIVLHNPRRGGHVLYTRIDLPKISDRYTKLWKEVEYSVDLADYLKKYGVQRPAYIDLDLNPDPKYQSNMLLRAALGYVESMGYVPRCKPHAMSASYIADALCH